MNKSIKSITAVLMAFVMVFGVCAGAYASHVSENTDADELLPGNFEFRKTGGIVDIISPYTYDFTGEDERAILGIGYPDYYNSMEKGQVTSVKDQGLGGNCWAFSTISCFETNAIKNFGVSMEEADYSENHLTRYSTGSDDKEHGDFYFWPDTDFRSVSEKEGDASVYDFSYYGEYYFSLRVDDESIHYRDAETEWKRVCDKDDFGGYTSYVEKGKLGVLLCNSDKQPIIAKTFCKYDKSNVTCTDGKAVYNIGGYSFDLGSFTKMLGTVRFSTDTSRHKVNGDYYGYSGSLPFYFSNTDDGFELTLILFSESGDSFVHVKTSRYFADPVSSGGSTFTSAAELASWTGIAKENSESERYVQDSGFVIDDALMSYDNSKVKNWIYNYGSVKADIFWDEAFEKDNTYYGKDEIYYGGHAVTVIGWDDNFSKDKFITKAPADGAWIVKNSWGTDSGDNGIYMVSYYDANWRYFTAFTAHRRSDYLNNYTYCGLEPNGDTTIRSRTATFANVYKFKGGEAISAVGAFVLQPKTKVRIRVFEYSGDEKAIVSKNAKPLTDYTTIVNDIGYYTIELPESRVINVASDKKYVVALTYTNRNNSIIEFFSEKGEMFNNEVHYTNSKGESYYLASESVEGATWKDAVADADIGNLYISVLTQEASENTCVHKYVSGNGVCTCEICGKQRNGYLLTYDANGGSSAPLPQVIDATGTVTSEPAVRDGYTFIGWAESPDSEETDYTEGSPIAISGDKTLYAVYSKGNGECVIVADPDGRIEIEAGDAVTVNYKLKGSIPESYVFKYKVENKNIVSCSWVGEVEDNSANLEITGKKGGTTVVTVYLYDQNDSLITSTTTEVAVEGSSSGGGLLSTIFSFFAMIFEILTLPIKILF